MGKLLQFSLSRKKRRSDPSNELWGASEEGNLIRLQSERERLKPPSFATFLQQVEDEDIPAGGETLSYLLGITQVQGVRATATFLERSQSDPVLVDKVESLPSYVKAHKDNDSLMLLSACFGLQGPLAINALRHLQTQSS